MSGVTSQKGEAGAPMVKKEEIVRAARVLFEPRQLVDIRLKGRDGHIASQENEQE
jgi:hypothetical protein